MDAVETLAPVVGTAAACEALTINRASLYRRRCRPITVACRRPTPPRALSPVERETVRDVLHSDRFVDKAPAQVVATLLDEDVYHCSTRTMYRVLESNREVRERRDQLRHPIYQKPELLATAPNQVWSWDITKLRGPAKWTYFYLYVILDIFSRYVVGWMLADAESTTLAKRLIDETCSKQGIVPGQLTIHADRGSSMKSHGVAMLLASLGITKTHSRPHVSNDNPYSEAHFKTLKYCPTFPEHFGSYQDGLGFCHPFFRYYNHEHRHSGIGLMTPYAVHYGLAPQITAARQGTLLAAYARHPERFVRKVPQPPIVPEAAWINPPLKKSTLQDARGSTIVTLDDACVPLDSGLDAPSSVERKLIEVAQ
jgi:transposase InsO family protein